MCKRGSSEKLFEWSLWGIDRSKWVKTKWIRDRGIECERYHEHERQGAEGSDIAERIVY